MGPTFRFTVVLSGRVKARWSIKSPQVCSGATEIDADAAPTSAQLRVQFIRENPELLRSFASNLLPQMLQVYNGSVVSQVSFCASFCAA